MYKYILPLVFVAPTPAAVDTIDTIAIPKNKKELANTTLRIGKIVENDDTIGGKCTLVISTKKSNKVPFTPNQLCLSKNGALGDALGRDFPRNDLKEYISSSIKTVKMNKKVIEVTFISDRNVTLSIIQDILDDISEALPDKVFGIVYITFDSD